MTHTMETMARVKTNSIKACIPSPTKFGLFVRSHQMTCQTHLAFQGRPIQNLECPELATCLVALGYWKEWQDWVCKTQGPT